MRTFHAFMLGVVFAALLQTGCVYEPADVTAGDEPDPVEVTPFGPPDSTEAAAKLTQDAAIETEFAQAAASATAFTAGSTATAEQAAELTRAFSSPPTDTPAPANTPTPAPMNPASFEDLPNDRVDCVSGAARTEGLPAFGDLGRVDLALGENLTVDLYFVGIADLAAALAAVDQVIEFAIGINDPARSLPPVTPERAFGHLANQYLGMVYFSEVWVPFEQLYANEAWSGGSPTPPVRHQLFPDFLRVEVAADYVPPAGSLYLSVTHAGGCDAAGLDEDFFPGVEFSHDPQAFKFRF